MILIILKQNIGDTYYRLLLRVSYNKLASGSSSIKVKHVTQFEIKDESKLKWLENGDRNMRFCHVIMLLIC